MRSVSTLQDALQTSKMIAELEEPLLVTNTNKKLIYRPSVRNI